MAHILYEQEILDYLNKLSEKQQREVLEYVRKMVIRPPGTPGKLAIQYAREINFDSDDLNEMERAIQEEFQRVDEFPSVNLDE